MQPLKKKRQQASPPKSECKVKTKCLINKKITQKKLSSPFFSPLFPLSIPPFSPSMSFLPRVECAATPSPPPPFPLPPSGVLRPRCSPPPSSPLVECAATLSQPPSLSSLLLSSYPLSSFFPLSSPLPLRIYPHHAYSLLLLRYEKSLS